MATVSDIHTFGVTPTGLTAPDSITIGGGSIFVEYGNGADSTGLKGSSTIIQYDRAGNVEYTYDIAGSVDGLRYNPYTGKVWALQNQDGNSTLSLIDPKTHTVSGPFHYANASATRGFDDVVFKGSQVFLSYTNPSTDASPNDAPTLVELIGGEAALSRGDLITQPILTTASTGVDTVTGKTTVVPQIDPDSLTLAPNGDLLFSSGDGGVIIEVHNPGQGAKQSVTYTPISGAEVGGAGLDDVIKPSATSGTFYVSDATGDRVISFHVSGLNTNDYYASVGGAQNAFGQIDPTTGKFTALVSNANEMGFGSPHGVAFVPDAPAATSWLNHKPLSGALDDGLSIGNIQNAASAALGFSGAGSDAGNSAYSKAATLLDNSDASSFAGLSSNEVSKWIADAHAQNPILASPMHYS
jgi:hypothetical protein